jgi:ligand-binding sensor domain-containing protein/serine phosphatase RsbU (regulator of sigma subunit)
MNAARTRLAAWFLLIAAAMPAVAQTYKLRIIGAEDGLSNSFVHALAQDAEGRLWIGTGEGVGRYDGHRVRMFTTADSLAENFVSCIRPDSFGNVWFGHNEGGISRMRNGLVQKIATADIASSTIQAMAADGHGGIWAMAQNNGILHVDADGRARSVHASDGTLWYSLLPLPDGRILAGTGSGLLLLRTSGDTLEVVGDLGAVTHAPVRALVRSALHDRIFAGTEDEGIRSFRLQGDRAADVNVLGADDGLGALHVRDLAVGEQGQLIVGTFGNGAYELGLGPAGITTLLHYDATNGLGTDNVESVFTDSENDLWFARFGLGLARLLDRSVVYYAADADDADVQALASRGHDVWFGLNGTILHAQDNDMTRLDTLGRAEGVPADKITALLCGSDGLLWAGTGSSGLFHQDATGRFLPVATADDRMARQIHALARRGKEIWAGTSNGVFILEGDRLRHLTTENGLLHNQVNALFTDAQGEVWAACNNGGVSVVRDTVLKSFTLTRQSNAFHVTGIAQDSTGTMWFSTKGNGVRYLAGDEVLGIGEAQGLKSDYCYAIAADGHGGIWTAHRGGVSRIDRRTHLARIFDRHFGLTADRAVNTVIAGYGHNLWFGTDKGVLRYDVSKDGRRQQPPPVSITQVVINGKDMPLKGTILLPPNDYRMEFDFLGISLKDPDAVTYRYKLEGHDLDWTETDQRTVHYMRIADGEYTFRVQASVNGQPFADSIATLRIVVRPPLWKRDWFRAVSVLALVLLIYTIVRIRERRARIARELLERKLAERTVELKTKKEEIEAKNKDITDSINYAQRIQQAILPSEAALTAHFPNSFILHGPRDIVSGDFYWFRLFGTKFILACADCTGHGVPGAFMSMIGSMLLREVSVAKDVNSPDVLLRNLDDELRTVLHYQGEDSSNHDGMDISICEIDMESRRLRMAAAMHDVLIVKGGELVRERGSRRSIGGAINNGAVEDFDLTVIQLEHGDRIYLFSDGVPDQFGGAAGKKLKISGLTAWIEETKDLPMPEQAKALRQHFRSWIGDRDQVDDVLLIGIEV